MIIRKSEIPKQSLVNNYLPANYSDAYECIIESNENITPDDLQIAFWTKMPKWIERLFKLRNAIVKPFGLKSDDNDSEKLKECIRTGKEYGIASVAAKSADETVVCLNDKHLKAYMSVYIDKVDDNKKRISVSTVVHFHNKLGYVYFYAIVPFHGLVVRGQIKHVLRTLQA